MSESQNGAVVVARDVTRRYGEGETAVDALRGVSVDIGRGHLSRFQELETLTPAIQMGKPGRHEMRQEYFQTTQERCLPWL